MLVRAAESPLTPEAGEAAEAENLAAFGRALQRERLPCFWLTPRGAVLPAFGSFTGSVSVVPGPEDRVFVIADQEVIGVA